MPISLDCRPHSQRFCDFAVTVKFYCKCDVAKSFRSPVAQKTPQVISNYQGRFLSNWTLSQVVPSNQLLLSFPSFSVRHPVWLPCSPLLTLINSANVFQLGFHFNITESNAVYFWAYNKDQFLIPNNAHLFGSTKGVTRLKHCNRTIGCHQMHRITWIRWEAIQ